MKKLKKMPVNNPGYFTAVFIMLLSAALSLSSCKRTNDDAQPTAALSVVNLIPGNSAIDFYLDNLKLNNPSMLYMQSLSYFNAYPGVRKFDVTTGGTFQALATDTATLKSGKYYSLFVSQKQNVQFLLTMDDLSDPPAGKAKVRFVDLSPDAPNVDMVIPEGTVLFTNQGYRSNTNFETIDPGIYTIQLHQAGNSVAKVTNSNVKIDAGNTYTIIAHGLWNGTGDVAINIDVMKN
jgi:hypothetical protein